jgi:GNAT superfamily N-acetyltransferase
MVACDLALLERWLTGWSLSRGLPEPYHKAGGLTVQVGLPDQLRRHVFADAGPALQACADTIPTPFIYLKAAVHADELRRVLDARWVVEAPRSMMIHAGAMAPASPLHVGYRSQLTVEHGGYFIRILNAADVVAAFGRITLHDGTAVYDRIATHEHYRLQGLASALMLALDALAVQGGVSERLLSATEAGAALYAILGWQQLAPYASAVLARARRARRKYPHGPA